MMLWNAATLWKFCACWIAALIHLLTSYAIQGTVKIVWTLVLILLHVIGAILYGPDGEYGVEGCKVIAEKYGDRLDGLLGGALREFAEGGVVGEGFEAIHGGDSFCL